MIGLLLNPFDRTVKTVVVKGDSLKEKHDLLSCSVFSGVGFSYKEEMPGTIFIDDEGLFKSPLAFFYIPELYPMPLCGKALFMGVDVNTGDSIDCPPDLIVDIINRDLEVKYLDRLDVIELERQILNGKNIS
tara:strand:+ start:9944 stop:10339 length:396 start_codon:yes stop_codon:yes gene_type:complete